MNIAFRSFTDRTIASLSLCAAFFSAGLLILIFGILFIGALPALSPYFIITPEIATHTYDGAIGNAVAGTIIISVLATIIAVPFALGTAIYLAKYATKNRFTETIRFFIEVLSGTPSIVVGVFGFLLLVVYLKPFSGGYSMIAGSIGLGILIMPVIERAAEEAILSISAELEEGSYALGATKWQTLRQVTLPAATSGILTGIILGFGRSAEESAVVIFTAGYSQFMPEFAIRSNPAMFLGLKFYPLQDLVPTLPVAVYNAFEHANIVRPANGFATAFVLIVVVLGINLAAKAVCSGMLADAQGKSNEDRWLSLSFISDRFRQKKSAEVTACNGDVIGSSEISIATSAIHRNIPENPFTIPDLNPMSATISQNNTDPIPDDNGELNWMKNGQKLPTSTLRPFLRTLLPFAIPAALLLLIAFLATIPPLHHALGKASPFLAGVFAAGLSLIIVVAGLAFALLFAKKNGAFKKKTRRTGYAGVIAGFCLVCIAGIICASSAAGVFSTGTEPVKTPAGDRNAQLAAMLAAGELGSDQPAGSVVQVQEPAVQAPATPVPAKGNDTIVSVPRKNALSIGESYSWGDAQHTSRATIYDYKVLPFYFWWWIDYNRFVLQVPAAGNSYLVVFIRIENTGTQSAIVPSADAFNVTYQGNSTGRIPYLNTSLISENQREKLGLGSSETLHEQYYQWIREIGQNKRDYAYLTGENLFGKFNSTSFSDTTSNSTTLTATNSNSYTGAYLKPGRSQAIDGYLIFEVPDKATKHLNETYVDVSFNSLSNGRWRLGQ